MSKTITRTPHIPIPPEFHPTQQIEIQLEQSRRISQYSTTIFASAFSPPTDAIDRTTDGDAGGRYLVACSSNGIICVWDTFFGSDYDVPGSDGELQNDYFSCDGLKRRKIAGDASRLNHDPVLRCDLDAFQF